MTGVHRPLGRARRWLLALLMLPGAVALWFAAGLLGGAVLSDGEAPGSDVVVRLVGTPIHYDFLLPATPETRAAFGFAAAAGVPVEDAAVRWILVGWGARDFYTTVGGYGDMTAGPVWRAITGDASVLRVEAWGEVDPGTAPAIPMGAAQYDRLLAAIVASTDGRALDHPGLTAADRFFGGIGRFDLRRTCNVWVGEMLRAAGLRFGLWTPTPQAVRLSLARRG